MITPAEERDILSQAYVPEHLVGLMTRVSGGEAFLMEDHLLCRKDDLVIVIGYPLDRAFGVNRLETLIQKVVERFRPARLALAAPELPAALVATCRGRESDRYYTLAVRSHQVRGGLRRVVANAAKRLDVERSQALGPAHEKLAEEFAAYANLPPRVRELLFRMWNYVGHITDAWVLNAWLNGRLSAFYVVDCAAADFATYVMGCRSREHACLGASDILFREMIRMGEEHGKEFIHLGLGVNEGIRRFKEKWGGIPGMPYEMCDIVLRRPTLLESVSQAWSR
jgi:hypothetical protein